MNFVEFCEWIGVRAGNVDREFLAVRHETGINLLVYPEYSIQMIILVLHEYRLFTRNFLLVAIAIAIEVGDTDLFVALHYPAEAGSAQTAFFTVNYLP